MAVVQGHCAHRANSSRDPPGELGKCVGRHVPLAGLRCGLDEIPVLLEDTVAVLRICAQLFPASGKVGFYGPLIPFVLFISATLYFVHLSMVCVVFWFFYCDYSKHE